MGEGFVERDVLVAVSADLAAVVECCVEGVSEGDGDVFDGVVWVYVEVAVACECEVEYGVGCEGVEHVVEEWDACVDG